MKHEREQRLSLSASIIRPEKLLRYGKLLVFVSLFIACIIVAVVNRHATPDYAIWIIISAEGFLLIENAVKMWGLKKWAHKIPCYVLDVLLLLVITFFTDGWVIPTLFVIILSEFYLTQKHFSGSIVMGVSSAVLFLVMSGVSAALKNQSSLDVWKIVSSSFNDLLIFVMHFILLNFTLLIYRKNNEIEKALEELNLSNQKLRAAYDDLQAVTVLQERQRIAKDIHDTAGHSITTVIMQTEAAKLVIDTDPADAKAKLISANLQAKHALEELRSSVHLLSGMKEGRTLKDELLSIVQESSDGTGVTVRYQIDDVEVCDAKARFLCNTLKEGISNGLRHGNANAFWFELKEENGIISFLLSDNGEGMQLADLKEGFGLSGMHTRASNLGGTVWFETEPEDGFEIHLTLPADGKPKE